MTVLVLLLYVTKLGIKEVFVLQIRSVELLKF